MRFLSVSSHVCARASFRHPLAGLPLPSASSFIIMVILPRDDQVLLHGTFNSSVYAHVGRTQRIKQQEIVVGPQ
jgi:hypothetical protein